eukprot:CAMPEP_0194389004 /NCGR_PEP_ID=MMETSP0174-20130528/101561_1 /TAXON_ID=216777 /ORGANISM="Proboscia alata, Strain PI-D3" /LENGTH=51 /DNA_ID=CAMNT_0039180837 /DNA_START=54 /DNA_END=205 /DNA_ORIENTATION=+
MANPFDDDLPEAVPELDPQEPKGNMDAHMTGGITGFETDLFHDTSSNLDTS